MEEGLHFQCKKRTLVFLYNICAQSCLIEVITAAREITILTLGSLVDGVIFA